MKLHLQGQKPCTQQSEVVVANGMCLPAVAIADAFASSLVREMAEQEALLADLTASFSNFKQQQEEAMARHTVELKALDPREVEFSVSQLTQIQKFVDEIRVQTLQNGLEVMGRDVLRPVNALSQEVDRLSAKVQVLEGELASQRTTSDTAAGVSSVSPMAPQQLLCTSAPPYPSTLIIDSADEAYLDGLSEDERYAVLEQRYNEMQQCVVERDTANLSPSESEGDVYPRANPIEDLIWNSEDEDFLDGLSEDERCEVLEERHEALQMLPVEQRYEALQRVVSEQRAERHFL
jgi:hypothetical protein